MADRVCRRGKTKTTQFRGIFCILLLQHLSNHIDFITNGYRTLFKDQLDRSKATCSDPLKAQPSISQNSSYLRTNLRSKDELSSVPRTNWTRLKLRTTYSPISKVGFYANKYFEFQNVSSFRENGQLS